MSNLRTVYSATFVWTYMKIRLLVSIFQDRLCCLQVYRAPEWTHNYVVVALLLGLGEASDGLVESVFSIDSEDEDESIFAVCPEVVQRDEDLLT